MLAYSARFKDTDKLMERFPTDLERDPTLRLDYINQVSFDEFLLSVHPELLDPERTLAIATRMTQLNPTGETPEEVAQAMQDIAVTKYAQTLYPDTSLNESLYLHGHTDIAERAVLISQWNIEYQGTGKEVPELDY